MWRDPIVEEVRAWRDQYAARFNYEIEAICRDARERQKQSDRKTVSFAPRRPPQERNAVQTPASAAS